MATLIHEAWIGDGDAGPTFCLAGPDGSGARDLVGSNPRLLFTITAGSHFEAMVLYCERMGWSAYTTEHASDHDPYSEDWRQRQTQDG